MNGDLKKKVKIMLDNRNNRKYYISKCVTVVFGRSVLG